MCDNNLSGIKVSAHAIHSNKRSRRITYVNQLYISTIEPDSTMTGRICCCCGFPSIKQGLTPILEERGMKEEYMHSSNQETTKVQFIQIPSNTIRNLRGKGRHIKVNNYVQFDMRVSKKKDMLPQHVKCNFILRSFLSMKESSRRNAVMDIDLNESSSQHLQMAYNEHIFVETLTDIGLA